LIELDQLLFDIMISCRLSTILGAKRLKVSDVCRATGIARATLDRYYNDRVKSFDRDVLGKLCQFLQVKPGDLLVVVEQGDLFGLPTAQDGEFS
jgi:putative transcriptional regulator